MKAPQTLVKNRRPQHPARKLGGTFYETPPENHRRRIVYYPDDVHSLRSWYRCPYYSPCEGVEGIP